MQPQTTTNKAARAAVPDVPDLTKVLTADDLAVIQQIVGAGAASQKFELGQTLLIQYGSYAMPFEIVGFEDVETESGDTVSAINLLAKYTSETNSAWGNSGSTKYSESTLRSSILVTYRDQLNADFVACLADTKVQTYSRDGSTDVVYDKLFAPAMAQLGVTDTSYNNASQAAVEGPAFAAYQGSDNAKRLKQAINATGTAQNYWTRSLYSGGSDYFGLVYPSGAPSYNVYSGSYRVVVACNLMGTSSPSTQKVLGTDIIPALKAKIPNLTGMSVTRANNLPPAVVTGFEATTYDTNSATLHLDTKDLATGGVSVQELELNAAVPSSDTALGSAGLLTANDKEKLTNLANITAVGDGLTLGPTGELTAEGGGAEVLNAWGTSTTAALSQDFLNTTLNGPVLQLGGGTMVPASGQELLTGIAIGKEAQVTGQSTTNGGPIAIGPKAKAVGGAASAGYPAITVGGYTQESHSDTIALGWSTKLTQIGAIGIGNYTNVQAQNGVAIGDSAYVGAYGSSVALGYHSQCGRNQEVAIGSGDTVYGPATRFLAHVRAGVDDTDAVNVKQMNDAIAAISGGGGSTEVLNEWGTSETAALSQNFLNTTLRSNIVNIGNSNGGVGLTGSCVTLGNNNSETGQGGGHITIGANNSNYNQNIIVGFNNTATNPGGVSSSGGIMIGRGNKITSTNNYPIIIGRYRQTATGSTGQIIIGNSSNDFLTTVNGDAIGHNANATTETALAFGKYTYAGAENAVALGYGARTTTADSVSFGHGGQNTLGPATRQLKNITAGELDTDAVNVKQMNDAIAAAGGGGGGTWTDLGTITLATAPNRSGGITVYETDHYYIYNASFSYQPSQTTAGTPTTASYAMTIPATIQKSWLYALSVAGTATDYADGDSVNYPADGLFNIYSGTLTVRYPEGIPANCTVRFQKTFFVVK